MRESSEKTGDNDSHHVSPIIPTVTERTEGPPLSLQWVSVGRGGKVSSVRTVRSHVSKSYHQRKKESRNADLEKLSQQRRGHLRPSHTPPEHSGSHGRKSASGARGEIPSPDSANAEANQEKSRQDRSSGSPTAFVPHRANLIPYAWFEQNGPILYVDGQKWPFQQALIVTGSDRSDRRAKSLTPRQSGWMPYTKSPDFTAVKGAVLDASVLSWIGQSPECFHFRVETIKWIQDQLSSPVKAISNATIGSIMTFAMWTAGYGNPLEMSNHMSAIERIVNLRGGFCAFEREGTMAAKLTLFDSMISVLTGIPPRLPQVNYFIARPISPKQRRRIVSQESPLYGSGCFEDIIDDGSDQAAILTLLKDMWGRAQSFTSGNSLTVLDQSSKPGLPFEPSPQNPNMPLLTLPLISHCDDQSHKHLLGTLVAASVLFSGALSTSRRDFPSPENDKHFRQLGQEFGKCSALDFWIKYPGIQLWVLLVGTAASRGKNDAAFWMFYLSRAGNFSDAESWVAGSMAIKRFLEIQKHVAAAI